MIYFLVLFLAGCASHKIEEIHDCVARMDDGYGDVCAESSIGYEQMNGSYAYYEGHKCAWEVALNCVRDHGEIQNDE